MSVEYVYVYAFILVKLMQMLCIIVYNLKHVYIICLCHTYMYVSCIGMARGEYEPDSASSQFFFLLFESDLTPAGKVRGRLHVPYIR